MFVVLAHDLHCHTAEPPPEDAANEGSR